MELPPATSLQDPRPSVAPMPWSVRDTWLGAGLMLLILLLTVAGIYFLPRERYAQIVALILIEAIYLLPVAAILGWKRIHWRHLGFSRFDWSTLGIGCGLVIGAYSIILVHNIILYLLGIRTQGDMLNELIQGVGSPAWLVFAGVILAPLVEEIFFRGFLFPGFRQRYGWVNALLLSSGLFALAHVDPASLLPTFLLGCVLAYVYHRSNSLWPGVILHFLINSFGLCVTFAMLELSKYYPEQSLYSLVINLTWLS